MKICTGCSREFRPSSNHRRCPACRARAQKHACPSCGRLARRLSTKCITCFNKQQPKQGEKNGNWRGGRTKYKNPSGYVYVRTPGHPRGQRNNGFVFEHIVVLEGILKRHLLPGETVHHRNGVRDDNRPENLELWVKPQPTGCRVEDAVAWAHQILARYENGPPEWRWAVVRGGGGEASNTPVQSG